MIAPVILLVLHCCQAVADTQPDLPKSTYKLVGQRCHLTNVCFDGSHWLFVENDDHTTQDDRFLQGGFSLEYKQSCFAASNFLLLFTLYDAFLVLVTMRACRTFLSANNNTIIEFTRNLYCGRKYQIHGVMVHSIRTTFLY